MGRLLSFICKLVGALTLLGAGAAVILLFTAGSWLPVQGEAQPADVIVVLSGSQSRALYAADLHEQGLAPQILVSRPWRDDVSRRLDELGVRQPRSEEVSVAVLRAKGVPASAIRIFGQANLSTAQEAMELQKRFSGQDVRLLVVTSPFHVRRTRLIFDDILVCCPHQVVGSPYEPFARNWWNDRKSAAALVLETAKFLYYLGGGRFVSSQEPAVPPASSKEKSPSSIATPRESS